MKKMNNKGFSLVELIIVIAIMAILIGILAPNLMRYIERTNVSADTQVIDGLRTAMITAMADPNNSTGHVAAFSTALAAANTFDLAEELDADLLGAGDVANDIANTMQISGWTDTKDGGDIAAALSTQFRSTPANAAGVIKCYMQSGGNIVIYITPSDKSGGRQTDLSGVDEVIIVGLFDQ